MKRLLDFICWPLIGALVAGAVTFAGFLVGSHHEMFTHDAGEVQAWAWFAAEMTSAGAAIAGFVLGGIYGFVRTRRRASNVTSVDTD